MPNHPEPTPLKDKIFNAIQTGEVTMTPRWHFVLKTFCLVLGSSLLILTLVYLSSFIIYMLARTGISTVPEFGWRGWYAFLVSLPWLLIGLSILFIIILEILVQRTAFAYRRPIIYSTFGILIIVIFAGFIVAATPLHRDLASFAEKKHLPLGEKFYRIYNENGPRDIFPGHIHTLIPQGFLLRGRHAELFTVSITPKTRLPAGADFTPGDFVVVFGPRENNLINAYGIRKVREMK